MEENNNEQLFEQQGFKKPCAVENAKLVELFKLSELILEKNYRLFIGAIIAMILVQSIVDLVPIDNGIFLVVTMFVGHIVSLVIYVFIIKKVKLDIVSIDGKRQRGSVIKQFLFTLFLYLLVALFFVAVILSVKYVYSLIVGTSIESTVLLLVGSIFMMISLPLIVLSIYCTCVVEALIFEIFAKNNVGFSAIKATFFNLHKSKNGTLSKLIVSVIIFTGVTFIIYLINYAPLVQSAAASTGLMDYVMMLVMNALMAIANVYFLTNRFIIYMSCRTE